MTARLTIVRDLQREGDSGSATGAMSNARRRRALLNRVESSAETFGTSMADLRAVYATHAGEIFRYCRRLVSDRGLAEEATQETFLRAWRAADRWDPDLGTVRAWLFTIAHNVSTDLLRARNVRFGLAEAGLDPMIDQGDPEGELPLEAAMVGWIVEEALRRIRPDQRQAILETYYKGRSYAEVSRDLGVPEGTLRSRVFYGLKALRLALEELGWEP